MGAELLQLLRLGQLLEFRKSFGETSKGHSEDLLAGRCARERDSQSKIRPRAKRLIEGTSEIRGRDGDDVRVAVGIAIKSHQNSVSSAMNIGWICRERSLAAGDRHRLDLIEKDDRGDLVIAETGDGVAKQLGDALLGLTVLGAHEPVGIYFDQPDAPPHRERGQDLGETPGKRRLPSARRPIEENQRMKSAHAERHLSAQSEAQQNLVQQAILEGLIDHDRLPKALELCLGRYVVSDYPLAAIRHRAQHLSAFAKQICKASFSLPSCYCPRLVLMPEKVPTTRRERSARAKEAEPVLGDILRSARKHRGLTLRDVEERTNIPNPHLSQIERGTIAKPDQQIVWKLSQLYELDFGLLSEWTGYKTESTAEGAAYYQAAIRLLNELGEHDLEEATRYLEALSQRRRHPG